MVYEKVLSGPGVKHLTCLRVTRSHAVVSVKTEDTALFLFVPVCCPVFTAELTAWVKEHFFLLVCFLIKNEVSVLSAFRPCVTRVALFSYFS